MLQQIRVSTAVSWSVVWPRFAAMASCGNTPNTKPQANVGLASTSR